MDQSSATVQASIHDRDATPPHLADLPALGGGILAQICRTDTFSFLANKAGLLQEDLPPVKNGKERWSHAPGSNCHGLRRANECTIDLGQRDRDRPWCGLHEGEAVLTMAVKFALHRNSITMFHGWGRLFCRLSLMGPGTTGNVRGGWSVKLRRQTCGARSDVGVSQQDETLFVGLYAYLMSCDPYGVGVSLCMLLLVAVIQKIWVVCILPLDRVCSSLIWNNNNHRPPSGFFVSVNTSKFRCCTCLPPPYPNFPPSLIAMQEYSRVSTPCIMSIYFRNTHTLITYWTFSISNPSHVISCPEARRAAASSLYDETVLRRHKGYIRDVCRYKPYLAVRGIRNDRTNYPTLQCSPDTQTCSIGCGVFSQGAAVSSAIHLYVSPPSQHLPRNWVSNASSHFLIPMLVLPLVFPRFSMFPHFAQCATLR